MLPVVAIVGRPNVGKSTLFNRIVGGRPALVAPEAGLTRDRHYATVEFQGRRVLVVDTGGITALGGNEESSLAAEIRMQAQLALDEASIILFVVSAREGITALDEEIARWLRRRGGDQPILFVVNKVDSKRQQSDAAQFYELGADHLFSISAEHGLGFDALDDALGEVLNQVAPVEPETNEEGEKIIRVALVGRPNAGKSALLNRLCGSERAIVSEMAGTTRDPIDVRIDTPHGTYEIVDTAGIRRKRRQGPPIEQLAVLRAERCIQDADVVCLLIDSSEPVSSQDARIAAQTIEAGRGLIVVSSKADLAPPRSERAKQRLVEFQDDLAFAEFAPKISVSAQSGSGVKQLLKTIYEVHQSWQVHVGTAELNKFLDEVASSHPPPAYQGRAVRMYFISQPHVRPPRFVVHANHAAGITESYRRYLVHQLRERFGLPGVPLHVFVRERTRSPRRFASSDS